MELQLRVTNLAGEGLLEVRLEDTSTLAQLKGTIEAGTGILAEAQRLVFQERVLADYTMQQMGQRLRELLPRNTPMPLVMGLPSFDLSLVQRSAEQVARMRELSQLDRWGTLAWLRSAAPEAKEDQDTVLAVISRSAHFGEGMRHASDELRGNRDFALAALAASEGVTVYLRRGEEGTVRLDEEQVPMELRALVVEATWAPFAMEVNAQLAEERLHQAPVEMGSCCLCAVGLVCCWVSTFAFVHPAGDPTPMYALLSLPMIVCCLCVLRASEEVVFWAWLIALIIPLGFGQGFDIVWCSAFALFAGAYGLYLCGLHAAMEASMHVFRDISQQQRTRCPGVTMVVMHDPTPRSGYVLWVGAARADGPGAAAALQPPGVLQQAPPSAVMQPGVVQPGAPQQLLVSSADVQATAEYHLMESGMTQTSMLQLGAVQPYLSQRGMTQPDVQPGALQPAGARPLLS